MKQIYWWSISIATLGSVVAVAATLRYYAQAHRVGEPGGYFALALGALVVGVLAGVATYYSVTSARPTILAAAASGLVVSLATAGVLVAALVSAFGS